MWLSNYMLLFAPNPQPRWPQSYMSRSPNVNGTGDFLVIITRPWQRKNRAFPSDALLYALMPIWFDNCHKRSSVWIRRQKSLRSRDLTWVWPELGSVISKVRFYSTRSIPVRLWTVFWSGACILEPRGTRALGWQQPVRQHATQCILRSQRKNIEVRINTYLPY